MFAQILFGQVERTRKPQARLFELQFFPRFDEMRHAFAQAELSGKQHSEWSAWRLVSSADFIGGCAVWNFDNRLAIASVTKSQTIKCPHARHHDYISEL